MATPIRAGQFDTHCGAKTVTTQPLFLPVIAGAAQGAPKATKAAAIKQPGYIEIIRSQTSVRVCGDVTASALHLWTAWRLANDRTAGGHVFVFRGRRGDLVKSLWWDGDGLSLFTVPEFPQASVIPTSAQFSASQASSEVDRLRQQVETLLEENTHLALLVAKYRRLHFGQKSEAQAHMGQSDLALAFEPLPATPVPPV